VLGKIRVMRIMLLGPPGAGKGSLAIRLAREEKVPYISPGDILRENLVRRTSVGLEAQRFLEEGRLLPVNLLMRVLEGHLKEIGPKAGFVGDALARTVPQARALDRLFTKLGLGLDAVIQIRISDDEAKKRIEGRRICSCCGEIYHTNFYPPKHEGICDKDASPLSPRHDDTLDVICNRLKSYNQNIAALVEYYGEKSSLMVVNGMQAQELVLSEIRLIIATTR
jgi:adenylate kinase